MGGRIVPVERSVGIEVPLPALVEVGLELVGGGREVSTDLDVVVRLVDVQGFVEGETLSGEELRECEVLSGGNRRSIDARVEAVRRRFHVVTQVVEAHGVHRVRREDPVVLHHHAVGPGVIVHELCRRGWRIRSLPVVVVERIPDEESVVGVEAVVDLREPELFRRPCLEDPVLTRRKGIAGRERNDPAICHTVVFHTAEEVGPVTHDRATQRGADAPLVERRLLVRELVLGAKTLVAGEHVAGAAEVIRARLGQGRDHRGKGSAVLRIKLVAVNLELLHRVLRDVDRGIAPDGVVDVASVNQRGVGVALVSRSAELHRRELLVVRCSAGHDRREGQEVPVQHRKILHLLVRDHRGRLGLGQLDQRRFRRNGHRFFNAGEIENELGLDLIAHEQFDLLPLGRETGEFGRDLIEPGLERHRAESTGGSSREHLRESGAGVQDRDGSSGQSSPLSIRDRPRNVPANDLSRGHTGEHDKSPGAEERYERRLAKSLSSWLHGTNYLPS